jgi:hypothetical protein
MLRRKAEPGVYVVPDRSLYGKCAECAEPMRFRRGITSIASFDLSPDSSELLIIGRSNAHATVRRRRSGAARCDGQLQL